MSCGNTHCHGCQARTAAAPGATTATPIDEELENELADALVRRDVKGALMALAPTVPDYAALKEALPKAQTPKQAALIRANMDRWRWLARSPG